MRNLTFISFILVTFMLSGCSWTEYFVIINKTDSDIQIEYQLDEPIDALDIFTTKPEIYKADDNDQIDWDSGSFGFEDAEADYANVKLVLEPGMVLKFGNLRNDNYESADQKFINEIDFNLKELKITSGNGTFNIRRENFDDHFIVMKGYIKFIVKN